jgi:cytoskeleton protein RodZ
MTTENMQTQNSSSSFGARLKTAREQINLEKKDVAAQLRLSEKYIEMMENDCLPSDLPITFARGYIRSYGKFLQIPEWEVQKALEPIKPKVIEPDTNAMTKPAAPVTSGTYFMQLFTYLIVLTMVGLVGTWWYRHSPNHSQAMAENHDNQLVPVAALQQNATVPTPTLNTAAPQTTAAAPVLAQAESSTAKPAQTVKPHSLVRNEEDNEPDNDETD